MSASAAMNWTALSGKSPCAVIREISGSLVEERVADLLKAEDNATEPKRRLPNMRLALNPFWWRIIRVLPDGLDVESVPEDTDPIRRLGSPYPGDADVVQWLSGVIDACRADAVRRVAMQIVDALVSGNIGLTGIRTPRLAHSGKRESVPIRVLNSRRWRLTPDATLLMDDATDRFEDLQIVPLSPAPRAALVACMETKAREFHQERRAKIKRVDLIEYCVRTMRCTNDDAEAAVKSVSPDLRRTRGEKDACGPSST